MLFKQGHEALLAVIDTHLKLVVTHELSNTQKINLILWGQYHPNPSENEREKIFGAILEYQAKTSERVVLLTDFVHRDGESLNELDNFVELGAKFEVAKDFILAPSVGIGFGSESWQGA